MPQLQILNISKTRNYSTMKLKLSMKHKTQKKENMIPYLQVLTLVVLRMLAGYSEVSDPCVKYCDCVVAG